jgi:hypothetical protein
MSFDVVIVVVVTSFIQSIFGVGVLLFGTPLLLLLGYDFIDAIIILLPISITINLIQIAKDYSSVDFDLYKNILIYTIPFVIVFLFLVTKVQINIGLIVGIFLLTVAVKDYSLIVNKFINFTMRYEKIYFSIMGIIHGLTNLGGSLLTAVVHSKESEKQITRVTVAISYATFAAFQILTLLISGLNVDIKLMGIGIYMVVGVTMFLLTEKLVYKEINSENYSKYFAVFLFVSGVLLCVKSI